MTKKLLIMSIALTALTACKKKEKKGIVLNEKYTCACHVSITYVDHCGEADAYDNSNFIYSAERSQAEDNCRHQGNTVSSTNTITTKTCELQ